LQHVPPLCEYKVWIDTERGAETISYLFSMAQLNIMEEEFRAHRMAEHKCAAYFVIHHEMDRERNNEKREERT
jgi:hypothetical protein